MGIIKDLTGQTFGKLTVIGLALPGIKERKNRSCIWERECSCDEHNIVYVSSNELKSGHTLSCGCLKKEANYKRLKKFNKYDLTGDYGIGYIEEKGEQFWFDLEDYEKIKEYCWNVISSGYIPSKINNSGNCKTIYLHSLIMENFESDKYVDHIDGNKFDCKKKNLRLVTPLENTWNHISKNIYKNPKGHKPDKEWIIQFNKNKKLYRYYAPTYEDAVILREEKRKELFGEFARKTKEG